ncbi:MAG: hypothetical protein JW751_29100 [Polyangiaceae bacterium]|nr:hypothetical protein [Polyangiaceae bacterium]
MFLLRLLSRTRFVLGVFSLFFAAGCGRRVSDDECRELLDHYTVRLLKALDPRAPGAEIDRLRLEAQIRLAMRSGLASCGDRVSRRAFDCAMRAGTPDEIERCLL